MTSADVAKFALPRCTSLFCAKGARSVRGTVRYDETIVKDEAAVKLGGWILDGNKDLGDVAAFCKVKKDWRDPFVAVETSGDSDVYRPNPQGYNEIFSQPHSALKSLAGHTDDADYTNYPKLQDFNLLFHLASLGTVLPQLGYGFPRAEAFSAEHGGYPWGAVVYGADGVAYISTCQDNTDAPSSTSSRWIPFRSRRWFNPSHHLIPGLSFLPGHAVVVSLKGGYLTNQLRPIVVWRMHTLTRHGASSTTTDSDGTTTTNYKRTGNSTDAVQWVQAYKYGVPVGDNDSNLNVRLKTSGNETIGSAHNGVELNVRNGSTDSKYAINGFKNYTFNGGKSELLDGGVYSLDWKAPKGYESAQKDSSGVLINPFNLDLADYFNDSNFGNVEVALDVSKWGYSVGDFHAQPQYDEQVTDIVGEFTVGSEDGNLRPGLVYLAGQLIEEAATNLHIPSTPAWTPFHTLASEIDGEHGGDGLAQTLSRTALGDSGMARSQSIETEIENAEVREITDPFGAEGDAATSTDATVTKSKMTEHVRLDMTPSPREEGVYFVLEASAADAVWTEIGILASRTSLFFPMRKTLSPNVIERSELAYYTEHEFVDLVGNGFTTTFSPYEPNRGAVFCGPGKYRIRVKCVNTVYGTFRPGYGRYAKNANEVRGKLVVCSIPYDHVPNAVTMASYESGPGAKEPGYPIYGVDMW